LTKSEISDYDELVTRSDEAGEKIDAASAQIKHVESKLAELSELCSHIINYSKTRNIYTAYHNAKDKKAYPATHRNEIALHESAVIIPRQEPQISLRICSTKFPNGAIGSQNRSTLTFS